MSSRFGFRIADERDDPSLRALLQQIHMHGSTAITLTREPNFFVAERAGSVQVQTIVCQDQNTGDMWGTGSRCIRRLYVNSAVQQVGYLSGLRLVPEGRNSMALVRAYRFLRTLHATGEVPFHITTVLEQNTYARELLEGGRAGMPLYTPVGTLCTYLIPLRSRALRSVRQEALSCQDGTLLLQQAHRCLSAWNSTHQFAPVYAPDDLLGKSSLLPRVNPHSLYVVRRGVEEVIGTLGVWDQRSFKQTVVTGYSMPMRVVKPWYNWSACLAGYPVLPSVGEQVRVVYAAFVSVTDNDPVVFEMLLRKACAEYAGGTAEYLAVGLSEDHPLGCIARRYAQRVLKSKIYVVHWPEDTVPALQQGMRIHLEVATL